MSERHSGTWRNLALLGAGLGAAIVVGGAIKHRQSTRQGSPDNAPGYTARRTFGSYDVVGRSVTIRKPRAELFAFWRQFSNLPKFMENLENIILGDAAGHNTWCIRGPMNKVVEVETRIAREIENELIAWRSTENSEIETEGRVTFEDAPGDRGTRVSLIIAYKPPGGGLGKTLAKFWGAEPEIQARRDLKRFKMLMETGEIATSARYRASADASKHNVEETA